PFSESTWVADWTIFYWAWWISWSPFVGSFIARVSYGRSVREFVLGVVAVPSLLGFAWFATFGGAALWGQMFGGGDMAGALAQGYETVLFSMYAGLPFAQLLSGVTILLLVIFFITSADSADRKSTRLNSSHVKISYAVFCLKKKKNIPHQRRTRSPQD